MLQMNGNTLAGGFQSRLNALSLRVESMGHPAIGVASGKRLKSLQEQIFRDRYRRQDSGNGPYGDVRWWDGDGDGRRERWVRVNGGGTVLPPGDSTHEEPPATGADLSWPYNNRYTAAHAALVAICEEYGIRWTGRGFGEDWHFDSIWNPYSAFAVGEAKPFEEDDMFGDNDRKELGALKDAVKDLAEGARPAHHAAPINFRSTTGGMSFTMIPGVQIIRHENTIAAALTLEFATGEKWPGWESERNPGGENASQRQREDIGERQLRDDEILVILAKFGFEWASRNIARLPDYGKVLYADWIMQLKGEDITS